MVVNYIYITLPLNTLSHVATDNVKRGPPRLYGATGTGRSATK